MYAFVFDINQLMPSRFVRRFADVRGEVKDGVDGYREAVRARSFPSIEEESYSMDEAEWITFVEGEMSVGRGYKASSTPP